MSTPGPDISVTDAAPLVDSGQVLLLDVREDHEWAAGHAPQAVHVPLGRLDPAAVPTDRPVLAVCRLGGRSEHAAQELAACGVDVRNVDGGMQAWAAVGLPLVRDDGAPGVVD